MSSHDENIEEREREKKRRKPSSKNIVPDDLNLLHSWILISDFESLQNVTRKIQNTFGNGIEFVV